MAILKVLTGKEVTKFLIWKNGIFPEFELLPSSYEIVGKCAFILVDFGRRKVQQVSMNSEVAFFLLETGEVYVKGRDSRGTGLLGLGA